MKEQAIQPIVFPGQLDLSRILGSHVANKKLSQLDPNPSSLLNNVFGPDIQIDFPNKEEAAKTVVGLFAGALDVFWDRKFSQNAKEQQFIDIIHLLKSQGLNIDGVVERLSLHLLWGVNSQKI